MTRRERKPEWARSGGRKPRRVSERTLTLRTRPRRRTATGDYTQSVSVSASGDWGTALDQDQALAAFRVLAPRTIADADPADMAPDPCLRERDSDGTVRASRWLIRLDTRSAE